jgi:Ca2+-binding EF-hand superfamily protein
MSRRRDRSRSPNPQQPYEENMTGAEAVYGRQGSSGQQHYRNQEDYSSGGSTDGSNASYRSRRSSDGTLHEIVIMGGGSDDEEEIERRMREEEDAERKKRGDPPRNLRGNRPRPIQVPTRGVNDEDRLFTASSPMPSPASSPIRSNQHRHRNHYDSSGLRGAMIAQIDLDGVSIGESGKGGNVGNGRDGGRGRERGRARGRGREQDTHGGGKRNVSSDSGSTSSSDSSDGGRSNGSSSSEEDDDRRGRRTAKERRQERHRKLMQKRRASQKQSDAGSMARPTMADELPTEVTRMVLAVLFERFDRNGDENIDVDEFQRLISSCNMRRSKRRRPKKEDVLPLLQALDVDGDGRIQLDEFEEWVTKGFHMSLKQLETFAGKGDTEVSLSFFPFVVKYIIYIY